MIAVAEPEYDNIAEQALSNLKEEIEPREVELKKTEVETRGDN